MKRSLFVYIACTMTNGRFEYNVRSCLEVASTLMKLGHTPFSPVLSYFHNLILPHDYSEWLEYDFRIIERADVLHPINFHIPSCGRAKEIKFARKIGKPILIDIPAIEQYARDTYTPQMFKLCEIARPDGSRCDGRAVSRIKNLKIPNINLHICAGCVQNIRSGYLPDWELIQEAA